ncbi:MAG: exo-alpha-sialidase [Bacteroidetes bacterium]|nr:exo-alpha-sialidase [Bacteroidota bacterium]MBU1115612.1 exo-alpha-sialidase [Bacteroidota bacterium]MBU1797081.1 exo-alpha-sialidase [Bacteroidota bacterium]
MKKLTLLLFILTVSLSAQLSEITRFPLQNTTRSQVHSSIVELDNNAVLFFWIEDAKIKVSKSSDGVNWGIASVLADSLSQDILNQDLITYKTNTGKILVAFKLGISTYRYYLISSIDSGLSWSEPEIFVNAQGTTMGHGIFSQTNDNKLWFTYKRSTFLEYTKSENDGVSWSSPSLFKLGAESLTVISVGDSLKAIFVQSGNIYCRTSGDSGSTWVLSPILVNKNFYSEPSILKKSDGTLLIVYKLVSSSTTGDIFYIESADNGLTWSNPTQFTKFVGVDANLRISSNSQNLYASFMSDRAFNENNFKAETEMYSLWYGIIGKTDDVYTPPSIVDIVVDPVEVNILDTIKISAVVNDDKNIASVFLKLQLNDNLQTPIEMFDDGLHFDGEANDSVYGIGITGYGESDILSLSVFATDEDGLTRTRFGRKIYYSIKFTSKVAMIDINRFKMPIDNKGILAEVDADSTGPSGTYDGETVLFAAGFGLSGYDGNELWANAVQSASRLEDYQPGVFGSMIDDPINQVYVLKSNDEPFGNSWQTWIYAVRQGAKFYDGNGDGVYTPIDLNSNGVWDANEDSPDLIGDVTAWTVFNDGVPAEKRRFNYMEPKDIEIKQTVFGYSPDAQKELDGVIFVKYEIENKSLTEYRDVYFSAMSDPDVGNYINDHTGCDTIVNGGYDYDKDEDAVFGNSPTFMQSIIQGAPIYIIGETYTDINSNGVYDDGIDTPLDTAKYQYGKNFSTKEFAGAKNQNMISFVAYMSSHPTYGDPNSQIELRNYQLGFNKEGNKIDPCNWAFGQVFNLNCNEINTQFLYSGNPVTRDGWISETPVDQRMMITSGPFELKPNEPIEIIVAYIVGRGNTSLESIDVTKALAKNAIGFYNTNFNFVPVGIKEKPQNQLPTEYSLSQNYPNPFNPSTTIKYSIPSTQTPLLGGAGGGFVTLKIYDILGCEVTTLVNKQQKAGNYEVQFDASNLTSGIYFYSLQSGSFNKSKKMILLK